MYFTDPKTYTGPVIAGWEPNKNRDMPVYIRPNESTVINDLSCFKFEGKVFLFCCDIVLVIKKFIIFA